MFRASLLLFLLSSYALPLRVSAQAAPSLANDTIDAAVLRAEVADFLSKELALHLADIKSLNPPPDKVLGAGTTGEYTWGTWMNALGAYAEMSGQRTLAGRDLAHEVGQTGLLEYRLGGTRFSQLYAVLALRHFGRNLDTNPVWQSLNHCVHPSDELRLRLVDESALLVKDAFDEGWARETIETASTVFGLIWLVVMRRFPTAIPAVLDKPRAFRTCPQFRAALKPASG